jgi:hypothetical protein
MGDIMLVQPSYGKSHVHNGRMAKLTRLSLTVGLFIVATIGISASGRIGYYGIVERVVFEPNESAPERLQVWGAFMYVDGGASQSGQTSEAKRGYLYFKLRSDFAGFTSQAEVDRRKREWADLKAIAGTGQAIGFGAWGYIGTFEVLQPNSVAPRPSFLFERMPSGGELADLRVRPANEPPSKPATYQTEMGIVKLADTGSHAEIVKQLKAALGR